ncbi:MAG: hypothetical protein BWZ10_02992 [candidate division BRC1 bacterium ADurb.BinA364]|nr:MAG: hypothetical protein BWZ10_02992 [candidate division BRC1 bacterium ADurb.BinA364]
MAWHTCRFVDAVAAAGKAEYPLPMFANAWLINAPTQKPGVYPSGGPVDRMLDIWMAGAPHLDALAPDIYRPDFRAVCQAYVHAGNPLVIPEARRDERCASTALYAIGEHEAVMFAPFGIDSIELPHPLTETYRALGEIAPLLLERRGKKMTAGFYQEKDQEEWTRDLGIFRLRVKTRSPLKEGAAPGGAIVVALEKDEYLIAGQGLNFEFESLDAGRPNAELLWVDEGDFRRGQWIAGRRLNGDENGHGQWINLDNTMQIVKAKIFAY